MRLITKNEKEDVSKVLVSMVRQLRKLITQYNDIAQEVSISLDGSSNPDAQKVVSEYQRIAHCIESVVNTLGNCISEISCLKEDK